MNRLYQIKGYKEIDGYIHPVTELCKDSDELMYHLLMSPKFMDAYNYQCFVNTDKSLTP